ncbi:(4Fe-4S)-binding protein [Geomonas sp. Red276]
MKKANLARIIQLLFLAIFLVLFVRTEYRGSDTISAAINSFFRADPLVLVSYLLSAHTLTWLLFPAVITLVCSALLGRFFCGWICPLGTLLDLVTVRIKKSVPLRILKGKLKYWLLFPMLVAAFLHVNLAGVLDPIAILVRGLTFFLYPIFGHTVRSGWVDLYGLIGERRDYIAPAYALLRDNLLPFRDTFYPLAFLSGFMFLGIIYLERYESRNWCRNLCPLGTLLGLAGRFSIFRRSPTSLCDDCKACRTVCPCAFEGEILQPDNCLLCMKCQQGCRHQRVSFDLAMPVPGHGPYLPERRVLLGGLLSGFLLAGSFRFRRPEAQARLLRPPGTGSEDEFLKKCVRCGECMKVCLTGALYPAVAQGGVEAVFTPVVTPRLGYCEYNCNLCGQVCPTAAIPSLPIEAKRRAVIGKAVLDKNHCLPYAKKTNCIVCEEHCPFPEKAIKSEEVEEIDRHGNKVKILRPYVVDELCNGCGICENVCPLEGKSGIEVFAVKDKSPLKAVAMGSGDGQASDPAEGEGSDPYGGAGKGTGQEAKSPAGKKDAGKGGSVDTPAGAGSRPKGKDGGKEVWEGENPYR